MPSHILSLLMDSMAAVDRISDLTDGLLRHIISFLPIKLAFITTILSKRWAPLFYSLKVLRFNYETENYSDFPSFCRFVDTFMLSSGVADQSIETFSLNCTFGGDFGKSSILRHRQHLKAWEKAAKQRRVQEFHLSVFNYTMKPIIFTSKTLVVLKLEWLNVESGKLCFDLPSLKTLFLKHVGFEYQNHFIKLLSACPILEDLHTTYPDISVIRGEKSYANWESPTSVHECVLSHLRSCTIVYFQGFKHGFRFAKYILRNAGLLRDMTVNVTTLSFLKDDHGSRLEDDQAIKELPSCPKVSPDVNIHVQRFLQM